MLILLGVVLFNIYSDSIGTINLLANEIEELNNDIVKLEEEIEIKDELLDYRYKTIVELLEEGTVIIKSGGN